MTSVFAFFNQPISLRPGQGSPERHPGGRQPGRFQVDNIQKTVADYYKIKLSDMHSKKRSRDIARPRQVAVALAKELTSMSLPASAMRLADVTTTVLHACKTIAETARVRPGHFARLPLHCNECCATGCHTGVREP